MKRIHFDSKEAIEILKEGKVLAFPTETVYGLGVRCDDYNSFNDLIRIKNRPKNKVFTLMLASSKDISKYAIMDDGVKRIIERFVPGPLTLILKAKEGVLIHLCSEEGKIGVRVPAIKPLQELIEKFGTPLLVPSANKSGRAPCQTVEEIEEEFKEELEAIIIDSVEKSSIPSTIIDCSESKLKLIRNGMIDIKELEEVYYE